MQPMFSFSKIFGGNRYKFNAGVGTVSELFVCNLKYLPDTSFEKINEKKVISGRYYTVYSKILKKKECGLFDFIEVYTHREFENKIISFKSKDANSFNIEFLKAFVNSCYSIYGSNSSQIRSGRFDTEDIDAVTRQSWPGRVWSKPGLPKMTLNLNREGLELNVRL